MLAPPPRAPDKVPPVTPCANLLYEVDPVSGRTLLHAMPMMVGVLCVLAVAYRYYSAFLAARVAALDDSRVTPAHRLDDGQNYQPTNKWVLFGHHFAAISGAGPLIGPVLAMQYGYAPGLIWLLVGVTLAGAVQDMLVLAASVRHDGKSLAEIARVQLGPFASAVASLAILFIVIIALAGLGIVVVKALGGEEVKLPESMQITLPPGAAVTPKAFAVGSTEGQLYRFPPGCVIRYSSDSAAADRPEAFEVFAAAGVPVEPRSDVVTLPKGCVQVIKGSSWGTFTIAATIPIALFVGLYMYKLRPGRVTEASVIGAALVLAATVAGNWIPGSTLEPLFSLTRDETVFALTAYGFVASVLPVWLLLGPRDYLSSFLKVGTLILLVAGVIVANPLLAAPAVNGPMLGGGPTFEGSVFPFVFICVMCGAVSGFHALVSSGTTPKMVEKESQIRGIGYGAMLLEGLVAVVALIAAASLPPDIYFDMNVDLASVPKHLARVNESLKEAGFDPESREARDRLHAAAASSLPHLDLNKLEADVGGESLRGRTGGAVTLAVGMSQILTDALRWTGWDARSLVKYWYHFAIMFEALFILTTIDAGTRIARFLVQEALGKVYAPFARPAWLPGSLLASFVVTAGWGTLIATGSIGTIWPMFGIANQLLAVLALALVTTWLVNTGRARYAWVSVLPMLFVVATTLTAGSQLVLYQFPAKISAGQQLAGSLNIGLTLFVIVAVLTVVLTAVARWAAVLMSHKTHADSAPV